MAAPVPEGEPAGEVEVTSPAGLPCAVVAWTTSASTTASIRNTGPEGITTAPAGRPVGPDAASRCARHRSHRQDGRSALLVAQAELLHLHLEALAADLEQPRGLGHVATGLVERLDDQLALDPRGLGAHDVLERARRRAGVIAAD